MIVAAVLISPSALHNLVHGVVFYAVIGLALPFVGWQTFLAVFAFPPSGTSRGMAVLTAWVGGTVLVAAVFNLVMAVADYFVSFSPPPARVRAHARARAKSMLVRVEIILRSSAGLENSVLPNGSFSSYKSFSLFNKNVSLSCSPYEFY